MTSFVEWRDKIFVEAEVDRKDGKWLINELTCLMLIGRLWREMQTLQERLATLEVLHNNNKEK